MSRYLRLVLSLPFSVKWFLMTEMLFGLGMGIWNINLNFHLKANGFYDVSIGSILAFGSVATAVFSFFAGGLSDRIGFHPAMMYGCIVKGIGMVLIALSGTPAPAYAGFLILSLGDSFILSSEFPFILSLVESENKALVYNLLISSYLFALFFGNIAGGYLSKPFSGMEDSYFIPVVISGAVFVLLGIARSLLPRRSVEYKTKKISFDILKDKRILTFLLYALAMAAAFNILNSMLNVLFKDSFLLEDQTVGLVFSIAAALMFASSFLVPFLSRRLGTDRLPAIAMAMDFLILLMMTFAGKALFISLWTLYSFIRLTIPGTVDSSMLQAVQEDKQGSYSGMRTFAIGLGMGVGSGLAGLILEYSGNLLLLISCAFFALLQFLIYQLGCRRHLKVSPTGCTEPGTVI